jgi:hypothetical protein
MNAAESHRWSYAVRTMRGLIETFTSPTRRTALVLGAAALMAAAAATAGTREPSKAPRVPRVIGISGLCIELPQRTPIVFGTRLEPGQRFSFPYPRQSTDHIDVLLPDSGVYTVDCWGWFTCWWTHEVPASHKENAVHKENGIVDAALGEIGNIALPPDAQEYEQAYDRGGSSVGEMVLENFGGRVDVGPMLLDGAPGTYNLRFIPHPASAINALSQSFRITLPSPDPDATLLRRIWPGLYAVTITGPVNANYWVLVTDSIAYPQAARALGNARALTDTWGDHINQQSVHNFLRAYLLALARRNGAQ